jgi:Cu-Zn family superoxide dismutase
MSKTMSMFAAMLMTSQFPAGAIAAKPITASAALVRADGTSGGEVRFKAGKSGVAVTLSVNGLPPGLHGLHLHAVGSCQGPDFTSAGGHWNPMHRKHGIKSSDGPHMGDLPNLSVSKVGKGHLKAMIKMATLDAAEMGLLDADGTAIVVHAGPDDEMTDPSGNSGARVLCGVIKAD